MERVLKENDKFVSRDSKQTLQGKPAQYGIGSHLNNSPHMLAQRKKLQNLFGGAAQLQGVEEELLQGKFETTQRIEEDELLQGKFDTAQRIEEEEPLQGKFDAAQRIEDEEPLQGKFVSASTAQLEQQTASKPNHTGLPDNLKSGIENLSGMSMDSVKVHYNSAQPAQLNAHAYAQGTDIHVAPGQEQHLPHEAWHVVQQAQGRVKPTMQMKQGVQVNDDEGLEHEADVMGAKAVQFMEYGSIGTLQKPSSIQFLAKAKNLEGSTVQGMFTFANVAITTLANLNAQLILPAYANQTNTRPIVLPIATAHFARGQTAAEVDTAVNNSNLALYDYIEVSDIWDAIDAELITLTAPPANHVLVTYQNASAYVNYGAFNLTPQQNNLLVDAVNNIGNARHQTANAQNAPAGMTGYIHDYGANAIFAFDDSAGNHRGIPQATILRQGQVNQGVHQF